MGKHWNNYSFLPVVQHDLLCMALLYLKMCKFYTFFSNASEVVKDILQKFPQSSTQLFLKAAEQRVHEFEILSKKEQGCYIFLESLNP